MSSKYVLLFGLCLLLTQCKNKAVSKSQESSREVMVPKQSNDFVRIYKPGGDYFFGPDTEHLKEGEWYDEWVPNDHTFIKDDDGKWHIFGITHPLVICDTLAHCIHEGENASFHAVSSATRFEEAVEDDHFEDLPKVLPPKERPGEILANHAPYIIRKDGVYNMIYGHSPMRLAVSSDLMKWEPKGTLFVEPDGARDPNLLLHDGTYYMVYCSYKCVRLRKSTDLINWSEPETIFRSEAFDPESPSLIFFNDTFYLFVCSWNGVWDQKEIVGAYQYKTYVLQSDDPLQFGKDFEKLITTLDAHAPEIFQGEGGQWYLSGVEWPNRGVSVDKITWVY